MSVELTNVNKGVDPAKAMTGQVYHAVPPTEALAVEPTQGGVTEAGLGLMVVVVIACVAIMRRTNTGD